MYRSFNPHRYEHIVFPKVEDQGSAVNLAADSLYQPIVEKILSVWQSDEWEFVSWVFAQVGLEAKSYRAETLQRRISACLRTIRMQTIQQARVFLEQTPSAVAIAVNALVIGVTSFFRDPTVFECLRTELRRDLSLNRRSQNIWSVGCSDGAELYSIAIVLAELGILGESYLLGTDCRRDAIEKAQEGTYETSMVLSIPQDLRDRYTERHTNCQRIIEPLRRQTRWKTSNILTDVEPGLWDVIFFRNTALYFRPEVVFPLWAKFEAALKPNGLLVLGRAERPVGTQRLRAISPCIYRRIQR